MNTAMNTAVLKLVDYMYHEEWNHFREEYDYDNESYNVFKTALKKHILYSVIVMKNNGNKKDIENEIKYLWSDITGNSEDEDEDEEILHKPMKKNKVVIIDDTSDYEDD